MEAVTKMISEIAGVERHIYLRESMRDKSGNAIQLFPYRRGKLKRGELAALPGPGILRSA
jgi:hypothetical protein